MRSLLIVVIVSAAFFLAARYAYHHLRPPAADERQSEMDATHALASLSPSCHRAIPPQPTSKIGEAAQAYDLEGLKLYIPAREAVASVAKLPQFKAAPDVLMRSCLSDELAYNERVRASEKPGQVTTSYGCIGEVTYASPKETLKLDLIEDLPEQPGCMVVKRVTSARDIELTDDKAEARLKDDLEKKYGLLDNQATLWGEHAGANLMLTRGRIDVQLELADAEFERQRDEARAKSIKEANDKAIEDAKRKRKEKH